MTPFDRAERMLVKSETSKFWLWMVNRLFWRVIPFNNSHRPTITSIKPDEAQTKMRLLNANKNHLGGMHACALATLAEYTCGLVYLRRFGAKYRIIMRQICVEYHVQCRTDALGRYQLAPHELNQIAQALDKDGKAEFECTVNLIDEIGQKVCTARVTWQLKDIPW